MKSVTKTEKPASLKFKSKIKIKVEKLANSFMFPIALLPLAGLLNGLGSAFGQIDLGFFKDGIGPLFVDLGSVAFTFLPLLFAISATLAFTDNDGTSGFIAVYAFILYCGFQTVFINNNKIFFWTNLKDYQFSSLTQDGLVFKYLNQSIFGGIIIGCITAYCFNKYKNIKLYWMLSFFEGPRFVPFVIFLAIIPAALITLSTWPGIGLAFDWFATSSSNWPGGLDVFFGNYLERLLVPFGLHTIVFSSLFFTQAGGIITKEVLEKVNYENTTLWNYLTNITHVIDANTFKPIVGDFNIFRFWQKTKIPFNNNGDLFSHLGIYPGKYMIGRFPFMMFGLIAGAIAIFKTQPKTERKAASGILGSGMATCFITGTTQPIEFAFLFKKPLLYWGPYSILVATCGMPMKLFGAHMATAYSGGLLDFIIFGIIPQASGMDNRCWLAIVVGICYIPLFFGLFYGWLHYSKSASLFSTSKKTISNNEVINIIEGLGGEKNISNIYSCSASLRVFVKDRTIVDINQLKTLENVISVIEREDNFIQIVVGKYALGYANDIEKALNLKVSQQT
ncbi:PTS transporter subunit EIIC [symbiont of Argiope bruennichi]|uniref:PTS transporter subunit EIIC n=1 Tax=symbiont of Argiope bruennichi TaxID=2810479 RepID=UPI003DA523C8